MSLFINLFVRIVPLYAVILLGFVATRALKVSRESIAKLLIYVIAPIIVFTGALNAEIAPATMSLPFLFYLAGCVLSLALYSLGRFVFHDNTRNILAFAAGTGNTGYFGLPVILAVFGDKALSPAVLATLGLILFENTLGFYLTSRGKHGPRESLLKIARLPAIYAFAAGLALNLAGFNLGDLALAESFLNNFKGAYTILGMMMIGMGLATVRFRHIDLAFISLSFIAKFALWPALMLLVILVDANALGLYAQDIRGILFTLSLVPLAANTVTFAAELDVHPDKAAAAVFLSTLFALFYIPLMTALFGMTA